jgi:hypothetical protein
MDLPADRMESALASIAAWRSNPDARCFCPVCSTPGLIIIDRSARPYAEWYVLQCEACSLDGTVHIPMAGPPES